MRFEFKLDVIEIRLDELEPWTRSRLGRRRNSTGSEIFDMYGRSQVWH